MKTLEYPKDLAKKEFLSEQTVKQYASRGYYGFLQRHGKRFSKSFLESDYVKWKRGEWPEDEAA